MKTCFFSWMSRSEESLFIFWYAFVFTFRQCIITLRRPLPAHNICIGFNSIYFVCTIQYQTFKPERLDYNSYAKVSCYITHVLYYTVIQIYTRFPYSFPFAQILRHIQLDTGWDCIRKMYNTQIVCGSIKCPGLEMVGEKKSRLDFTWSRVLLVNSSICSFPLEDPLFQFLLAPYSPH